MHPTNHRVTPKLSVAREARPHAVCRAEASHCAPHQYLPSTPPPPIPTRGGATSFVVYSIFFLSTFRRFDGGFLYLTVVDNISISVAFYVLLVFYNTLHVDLAPFRPVWKFLCVKMVIFFSFWQSMVCDLEDRRCLVACHLTDCFSCVCIFQAYWGTVRSPCGARHWHVYR